MAAATGGNTGTGVAGPGMFSDGAGEGGPSDALRANGSGWPGVCVAICAHPMLMSRAMPMKIDNLVNPGSVTITESVLSG